MSKQGSWLFARGTLKAHYVKEDGSTLCGRKGLKFDKPIGKLNGYECKTCQKRLQFISNQGGKTE